MASNIVSSNDRNWIKDTYKAATALQSWVDVLDAMSDQDKGKVSKHLSGDAFDVQPQAKDGATIKGDIKKLPGLTKFLDREGGLERWHAQF
jgi:hypothetical protein